MPPKPPQPVVSHHGADSDDSDFESEDGVTNVQLGLSDGPVEGDDEFNPLVPRIGGKAAWLPTTSIPPPSVAHCKYCDTPMELLVQIFAPLEKSPYDRVLLAWGCCRPACQRKGQGSLRVIRHLQYNARWAARLEKQRQKKEAREERKRQQLEQAKARKAEEEAKSKVNPFSMDSSSSTSTASTGLGSNLFGGGGDFGGSQTSTNPFAPPATTSAPEQDASSKSDKNNASEDDFDSDTDSDSIDEEAEEEEQLADELAMKTAVQQTAASSLREQWSSQTSSYRPALYLNTVSEASSSARAGAKAQKKQLAKQQRGGHDSDDDDDDDDGDDAGADEDLKGFEKEGYERMMLAGMDDVLEKFIARVGAEGRQVVRYEMGGQPLPFSAQGDLYKQLWPTSTSTSVSGATAISRAGHAVNANANGNGIGGPHLRRTYDASRIPRCETCGSKRTFEFQLMPNLVNTLRADCIQGNNNNDDDSTISSPADALDASTRRRRELEAVLGKSLPSVPGPGSDGITRSAGQDQADAAAKRLTHKTGLCWATAMVFVCEKDCCILREEDGKEGETWREEWVGLQFED